jgi:catechol 2,3-dioxygenase
MQLSPQGPVTPAERAARPIDPGTRIGHVHLRTSDIERIRRFYVDVLGFDVVFEARDVPGWGTTGDILFVSAGGYHHHLGFNTWRGDGVPPAPDHTVGLRHWTVQLPTAADVDDVRARVERAGTAVEPDGAALTVRDPWRIALRIEPLG